MHLKNAAEKISQQRFLMINPDMFTIPDDLKQHLKIL